MRPECEIGMAELAIAPESTVASHPFAIEITLLILCLRGEVSDIPAEIDWLALQRLAEENGVLLPAHRWLKELGADLPDSFQRAISAARAAAEGMASELGVLI